MGNAQIIILVAGRGKRMESDEPKALTKLAGKPFLKYILDTLAKLNLSTRPVIVVGHKKERIFDVIGKNHIYAYQKEQLGTGHAVLSAKNHVNPDSEIIVILSGDQPLISKETLERIIETHQKERAIVTLGTVLLPDFKDWREGIINFGRIIRDRNKRVTGIVEYKDTNENEKKIMEINPALYTFDAEWLWNNINKIKKENSQKEYYLTDLVKLASEEGVIIETVPLENMIEVFQPNYKAELEVLEKLIKNKKI